MRGKALEDIRRDKDFIMCIDGGLQYVCSFLTSIFTLSENVQRISTSEYFDDKSFFQTINRIQAMAPILAPPFWGAYYKGTYLPQNRMHSLS